MCIEGMSFSVSTLKAAVPCEHLTMLSWPTMVNHGSTMVGNVTAGGTDHGHWTWSDHVNMVMSWYCI